MKKQPDFHAKAKRVFPVAVSILAGIVFPLHMWVTNLQERPTALDLIATFGASLTIAVLGIALFSACFRDLGRAALAVALLTVFVFGYGHLQAILAPFELRHRWVILFWSAAFAMLGLFLVRCQNIRTLYNLNRVIAITLGCIGLMQVAQLTWAMPEARLPKQLQTEERQGPDIYFIVVDGYARSDMLIRYANFDNESFHKELENRGCIVRTQAVSNYSQTLLSVPSTLSLEYLDLSRKGPAYRMVTDSKVSRIFQSHGYLYRYLGSAYAPLARAPEADIESYLPSFPSSYASEFLSTTIFGVALSALSIRPQVISDSRPVIQHQLEQLKARPVDARPMFTFAHLMLPHPPFIYGRNGPLSVPIGARHAMPYSEEELSAYVGQIEYLNIQLLGIIDAIDKQAEQPPIIVIQADHGGGFLGMPALPSREQIAERMSIFSAVRVPDSIRQRFYPSMTSVNLFRIILNGMLDVPLEKLADRSYYSCYEYPRELVEYLPPMPMLD